MNPARDPYRVSCQFSVLSPGFDRRAVYYVGSILDSGTGFSSTETDREGGRIGKRPTNRPTATDGYMGGRGVTMNVRPMSMPGFLKIRPMGRLRNNAADRRKDGGGITISVKKFAQCNATHRIAHFPQSCYNARELRRRRARAANSALARRTLSPPAIIRINLNSISHSCSVNKTHPMPIVLQ